MLAFGPSISTLSIPKANAVFGVGDNVIEVGPNLVTNLSTTINTYLTQLKSFVLDGLVTMLARMILQQMTNSVVNWINSGFKGSPSFVTDPAGFFQNVGDQMTGSFLAKYGGPLTNLCSPFSYDIRVSLALDAAQNANSKGPYTCTLGSIITNTTNAAKNATLNGSSIAGFVGGDFKQGGWPAFVSMTTEPQNNVYGAYQQAKSQLNAQVAVKQASVSLDLTRGGGFMSFQSCTDVGTINPNDPNEVDYAESQTAGDTTISTVNNKDGSVTYQSCKTETPGSVINGALTKQLGAGIDQLNLTNQINQIVSALMAQLVSTVLSGGLHSFGSNTKSTQNSFASYAPSDLPGSDQFNQLKNGVTTQLSGYTQSNTQYQSYYNQALQAISNVRDGYIAVRLCFSSKLDGNALSESQKSYASSEISDINSDISSKIQPLLDTYQADLDTANERATALNNIIIQSKNILTFDDINDVSNGIHGATLTNASDVTTAQNDLTAAQGQAQTLKTAAAQYQNDCDTISSKIY